MILDSYCTRREAAQILGVSTLTIWRWLRSGKLSAEKVGREVLIKRVDLSSTTRSNAGRKPKSQLRSKTGVQCALIRTGVKLGTPKGLS